MATSSTAAGPDTPVASSPIRKGTLPAFVGWFQEIAAFIRSLSPDGVSAYRETATVNLSDTTNFELYSGQSTIQARREGRVIQIWGTISCTKQDFVTGSTERIFATLPENFRPRGLTASVMAGSSSNTWVLRVTPEGQLIASSYSGSQPPGVWMPINIIFFTA